MTAPDFSANLLFQSVVIDPEGEQSGYRIDTTGRYTAKMANDAKWKEQLILSSDELEGMTRLLDGTNKNNWRGSVGQYRDDPPQSVTWIQFRRQGEVVSLRLFSGSEQPDFVTDLLLRLTSLFREY